MTSTSCNNKYVYDKFKFVPCHPAVVHQFQVGEIIRWYADDCTSSQTDQHVQFNRNNIKKHDWGNLVIASDKVTVIKLKSEAKVDGGEAISAETSLAFDFEDNDQQVIKADGCECLSWDTPVYGLEFILKTLFNTKKEYLKAGSYAVIISVITAQQYSIVHGHRGQIAFTSKIGAVFLPVSANLSIDLSKKTEISFSSDPLKNRVVGFQIWPFTVSWFRRAIKLGENRMGESDDDDDFVEELIIESSHDLSFRIGQKPFDQM